MAELVVEHLEKSFPTRGEALVVLRDASLQLSAGQNAAILGPSGSGKSTLLFIIGTLDAPTGGSVRLNGVDPFSLPEGGLADFRNRHIGFVFQDHYLLPQLTVLENVLVPALAGGTPSQETVQRAKELVARVGLSERMEHRPAELSGGERQRVGVARALLLKPAIVLADEPTGNLDKKSAAAIGDLLIEMQRQEQTMLLTVTHSLELAQRLAATGDRRWPAERVGKLKRGLGSLVEWEASFHRSESLLCPASPFATC
jgi:lipoprotein-releasing system ATP-binding protein